MMKSEIFFLVERDDPEAPRFLGVNTIAQSFVWDHNRRRALRFSRMIDAQNILAALHWPKLTTSYIRVVEYHTNKANFINDEEI